MRTFLNIYAVAAPFPSRCPLPLPHLTRIRFEATVARLTASLDSLRADFERQRSEVDGSAAAVAAAERAASGTVAQMVGNHSTCHGEYLQYSHTFRTLYKNFTDRGSSNSLAQSLYVLSPNC